jgi:mRNA-degrading endonuclease RelE of RelBE toxin-antitoxin system
MQVREFFIATQILETYPYSGRIVPEFNNKNIRELIIGLYRLIYSVSSENKVVILTVHNSYRKLKKSTLKSKR